MRLFFFKRILKSNDRSSIQLLIIMRNPVYVSLYVLYYVSMCYIFIIVISIPFDRCIIHAVIKLWCSFSHSSYCLICLRSSLFIFTFQFSFELPRSVLRFRRFDTETQTELLMIHARWRYRIAYLLS